MTMRNIPSILVVASAVGCYSGLDSNGSPPSLGDDGGAADDDGPTRDDAGEGEGGGEGGSPNEPEPDPPFELPAEEVELLPFHVRLANLERVTGLPEEHFAFTELLRQRHLLGDHDYAAGIAPDLHWAPQKMQVWVKGLIPVCDSVEFKAKYPDLLEDPSSLVQAAFGRDPTDAELEGLGELAAEVPDLDMRYRMTCLSVVSSLEFVAK
jgi:hypothetical protein